jgi:hypothetical protein
LLFILPDKTMEQAYIIARLKEITISELLDALAEASTGEPG